MYKICNKCKEEKLFSAFCKNRGHKDGYNSRCKVCVKESEQANKDQIRIYQAEYREANKDKAAAYHAEYREANKDRLIADSIAYRAANKDRIAAQKADYYLTNKEQKSAYDAVYRKTNRDKVNARSAKRRATKLQATPLWLTEEDKMRILKFYTEAKRLESVTGQKYHVDHIIPLQGEIVCGLHVPWNLQVLSAVENRDKSNKLLEN